MLPREVPDPARRHSIRRSNPSVLREARCRRHIRPSRPTAGSPERRRLRRAMRTSGAVLTPPSSAPKAGPHRPAAQRPFARMRIAGCGGIGLKIWAATHILLRHAFLVACCVFICTAHSCTGKPFKQPFSFTPPLRNRTHQRCVVGGGALHFYGMLVISLIGEQ